MVSVGAGNSLGLSEAVRDIVFTEEGGIELH